MRSDRFDQTVAEWLHAEAGLPLPDHLADVLARTSRTRQRPWWSSRERWLPMQLTQRIPAVPRAAWLVAIVALLVAMGVAVLVVGSPPRLPAPFGLARNGVLAYGAADGDIRARDPRTSASTPLINGPERDLAPFYSRDGSRFAFLRGTSDHQLTAFVAGADGTAIHAITGVLTDQDWWDWSYDGTKLAIISSVDDLHAITVASADGSGWRTLDVGMPADFATWRGPDDRELIFRGYPKDGFAGIFAVKPDGTGLRQLSPALGDSVGGYQYPQASQDGTQVAYGAFEPDSQLGIRLIRLHILDLATGKDVVIPALSDPIDPTLPTDESGAQFSADGRQIVFTRDSSDDTIAVAVAPSDGSSPGHVIGPAKPRVTDKSLSYDFSPDASMVVARYPGEDVVYVLPVDGSAWTTLPLDGTDLPSWQRLAP